MQCCSAGTRLGTARATAWRTRTRVVCVYTCGVCVHVWCVCTRVVCVYTCGVCDGHVVCVCVNTCGVCDGHVVCVCVNTCGVCVWQRGDSP
jgi:hypothetical protein